MPRVKFLLIVIPFLLLNLGGCSSAEKTGDTPEDLYKIAEEFEGNERYELAVQRYTEVRNKFPYSSQAVRAELAIADVHYKQEDWAAAQISYQTFQELHPTHPKIDYVIYRIGMSYWQQLPDSVDRDLSLAKETIAAFEEVVRRFPKSEYVKESKEKIADALSKLAGKEDYIADFYFKRGMYQSSLARDEGLLKTYPGRGFDARALARASIAAGKQSQKDKQRRYLKALEQKFPNSSELDSALKESR